MNQLWENTWAVAAATLLYLSSAATVVLGLSGVLFTVPFSVWFVALVVLMAMTIYAVHLALQGRDGTGRRSERHERHEPYFS